MPFSSFVYGKISFPLLKVKRADCHLPYTPPRQDHQTQTDKTSDDGSNNHTQISVLLGTGLAIPGRLDQGRRRYVHLGRCWGYNRQNRRRGDPTVRESHD